MYVRPLISAAAVVVLSSVASAQVPRVTPAGDPSVRADTIYKWTLRTANGRHSFTWATADLPQIKPEVFAADSNSVFKTVQISSATTWAAIGK